MKGERDFKLVAASSFCPLLSYDNDDTRKNPCAIPVMTNCVIFLTAAQEPDSEVKNVLENVLEHFLEIFLEICYTRKMKKSW